MRNKKHVVGLGLFIVALLCASTAFGDFCEIGWSNDSARFLGGRYRAGAGFWDGKVYLWGGGYVIEDPEPYRYYDDMQVYNPAIDEWTTLSPMPEEKSNFGFAILDGYAYAVAGYWTGGGQTHYLDSCARYDIDADAWETIADYPDTLAGLMCGAGGDGKLYCFGGWDGVTDKADAYTYHPGLNFWTPIADMPHWKDYGYAIGDGSLIYITGGWAETGADAATYAYDPATNQYDTMPSPTGRQSPVLAAAGGVLWLAGGCDETDEPLHVYNQVYDGESWIQTGETMTFDRASSASAYAPGYGIFVMGGWDDEIQESRDVQLWNVCVPGIAAVDPLTGPPGTVVTITGSQFENQVDVFLSDGAKAVYELEDVNGIDSTSLTAAIPDDVPEGTYDLLMTGSYGQTGNLTQAFTVTPATDDDDDDDNDDNDSAVDDDDNDNDSATDDDDNNDDSIDDDTSPTGDDDDTSDDDDAAPAGDDDDDNDGCGC